MRISLMTALLISASSMGAFAQDIPAQSHISGVTVYPQGADVIRTSKIELPLGENALAFNDLPADVDPQSIRVEGSGLADFEIGSIDTKLLSDVAKESGERQQLESQIEKLADTRSGLDQTIADQEIERKLLLTLADKARVQTSSATTPNTIDVAGFDGMLSTVAQRLVATSKVIQDAKIQQRQIDKDVASLNEKIQNFAPQGTQHLQAMVHVNTLAAETVVLKLTYRVRNAGWHAFYDAKLALPKGGADSHIALVRRADVQQITGEDWNDVRLVLSTAQPAGNAAAPTLGEEQLSVLQPEGSLRQLPSAPVSAANLRRDLKKAKDSSSDQLADGGAMELDAAKPAKEQQAQMQQAGFDANYVIEGQVSIDKNGTSKKVNIGTDEFKAKLIVEAVPRLDLNAYLSASFVTSADAPLLAGPVNLFRDGSFVGQIAMSEYAAGEEAKLGFGVDELVKVKRAEVKRLAAQQGFLTSSDTQEMAWIISVSNLHTEKMLVRVLDRKPFSSDAKIIVEDILGATPPTVTDVEKKRGILAWDLTMEPKAKSEIHTGYKITSPKDVTVGMVD